MERDALAISLAFRVEVWNDCKRRGMRDEDAYAEINRRVEEMKARALAHQDAPHDR